MLSQQGSKISCTVSGPLGKKTGTDFVWIEKNQTAVIEVARACGMMMIAPEEKNPDIATSYGVGELILHALKKRLPGNYSHTWGNCFQ